MTLSPGPLLWTGAPKKIEAPPPQLTIGGYPSTWEGQLAFGFYPPALFTQTLCYVPVTSGWEVWGCLPSPIPHAWEKLCLREGRSRMLPALPPINSSSLSLPHPLIGRKFHVERSKLRRPWAPTSPQHPLMEHRCNSGKSGSPVPVQPRGKGRP